MKKKNTPRATKVNQKKGVPLDIIVCIKPVPDPKKWDKLKLDPQTMLLSRAEIPPVINALDRNAIEAALRLVEANGGTISLLTMAPPTAEAQLREALAMGCNRAYLLSDRLFAGGDTLATARTLAAAIRRIGRFDLILCGAYTLDGSTSQVGPQLAEMLALPDLTHAVRVELAGAALEVECRLPDGTGVYSLPLPALVTLEREANQPRLPSMRGIRNSSGVDIVRWTATDIGLTAAATGLEGSPTQMLNVFTPALGRRGDILQGGAEEIVGQLLEKLRAEQMVP